MRTSFLIAAAPGLFDVGHHPGSGVRHVTPQALSEVGVEPGRYVSIGRCGGGLGFLINLGPATLKLEYVKTDADGQTSKVGPRSDYVAPGACKEFGIGEGVRWSVVVAG